MSKNELEIKEKISDFNERNQQAATNRLIFHMQDKI